MASERLALDQKLENLQKTVSDAENRITFQQTHYGNLIQQAQEEALRKFFPHLVQGPAKRPKRQVNYASGASEEADKEEAAHQASVGRELFEEEWS